MYKNPRIRSRQEFKQYCLRALGAPVIQVNVSDEQVEDRIDDALSKWWEFHTDGTTLVPVKVQITQEMIDSGVIPLPDNVSGVSQVLGSGVGGITSTDLRYQSFITDVMEVRNVMGGSFSMFAQSISYLATIGQLTGSGLLKPFEFNSFQGYISIVGPNIPQVGDWFVLLAYVVTEPEVWTKAWSSQWLKEYATELIRRQWGNNLIKMGGAQLPGGVQINGGEILSEAKERIEKLEEELRDTWAEMPMMFMG